MTTVKLISLTLSKFKGAHDFKLDLNGTNARIMGDNATGKTTIADAFTWLLFDKDTKNQTEFEIKTIVDGEPIHNAEHKVEAVIQVDATPVKLAKIYKEKWTKRRGTAKATFSGHTTDYYIDDVPTKKKEYDAYIANIISEDVFKLLTSPSYFNEQLKWKAQRDTLLNLVGGLTNDEVFSKRSDLKTVESLLNGKSEEAFKKMIQEQQRRINEDLKMIPARIAENQAQLSDVADDTDLQQQLQTIEGQIEDAQQQIFNIKNGSAVSEKRNQLFELQNGMKTYANEFTYESQNEVLKLKTRLSEEQGNLAIINGAYNAARNEIHITTSDIESTTKRIEQFNSQRESLLAKWHEVNAQQLEHKTECVCPTCDQELPTEKVEAARQKAEEEFNLAKSNHLSQIQSDGKSTKEYIDKQTLELVALKEELTKHQEKASQEQDKITKKKEVITNLQNKIEAAQSTVPDITKDEKYQAMQQDVTNLQNEISALESHANEAIADIEVELVLLKERKAEINAALGKIANAVNIKKRIIELTSQEEKLSEQYQRLSEQLYTVEQFVRAKVEMLEEKINSHFKIARFKLFNEQIDGGLTECCEVMVDGVTYSGGLNNAMRINVGLDIINALSAYHGTSAPIFIDNAESVTQLIDVNAQTIALVVSEQDKELRVIVGDEEIKENKVELNAISPDVQERLNFLEALEAAGVDNWEGYDYAQEILEEQEV